MGAAPLEQVIFNFSRQQDLDQWMIINDTVMGGVSRSAFQPGRDGTAVFSGAVSLDNYGGFCSATTKPSKPYDLGIYEGIAIQIKGDGKHYKLTLKSEAAFMGFSYQYPFQTKKDAWTTIYAPFDAFKPFFRGTLQADVGAIDRSMVASFGLLISDKQSGPFRLEIRDVRAYAPRVQP